MRARPIAHLALAYARVGGERSQSTNELRKKILEGCEKLIWDFFHGGGQVVIYDANNGTRQARATLAKKFTDAGIHVIMLGAHTRVMICWSFANIAFPQSLYAITKRSLRTTYEASRFPPQTCVPVIRTLK